jgi:hypothetical protein
MDVIQETKIKMDSWDIAQGDLGIEGMSEFDEVEVFVVMFLSSVVLDMSDASSVLFCAVEIFDDNAYIKSMSR